jgi:phosphatidate cytidylyltransferase
MKRILTATVLIIAVVALVLFGAPWMVTVFAAIVAALAAYEYVQIAAAGGSPVPLWWMAASVTLFFLVVHYQPQDTIAAVSLATLLLFAWSAFTTPLHRVLGETAAGLFALLYICYPLTLLPRMLVEWDGPALLLFLFLCVWCGDIAALYIGKRYGRHKLSPRLSPNKTWEGAIASVFASVAFGMALVGVGDYLSRHGSNFTRLHTSEPWWHSLILAIILNIAAQLGDLLESALKRGVNLKDSGTLLPGHGGILDRIDALLIAAPVLWFVLALKEYYSMGIF